MNNFITMHQRVENLLVEMFNRGYNPYTGREVTHAIHADRRTIAGFVATGKGVILSQYRADIAVWELDKKGKEHVVLYEVKHKNDITKEKRAAYRDLRLPSYEIVIPNAYAANEDMDDGELESLLKALRPIEINTEDKYIITLPNGKEYSFREYEDREHAVKIRAGRGGKKILMFKFRPNAETVELYKKNGWDCYEMSGYDPTKYFGQNIDRCKIIVA